MKKHTTGWALGLGIAAATVWTAASLQAAPTPSHSAQVATYNQIVADTTDTTKTPAPDTTTKPDSTPAPDTTKTQQ